MCNIYRSVPDAGTHLSLSHVSPARPPRPLDSLTHLPTSLAGFAIWNCHTNHQQSSPCPPSQHGAKDLQRRHQTGGTLTQRGAKGRLSRRNPGGGRGGGVFAPQKSKTTPVIYQSEDGHPENAPLERAPQEGGGGTFTSRTRGGTTLRRQSPRSQFVCICMCVYIM